MTTEYRVRVSLGDPGAVSDGALILRPRNNLVTGATAFDSYFGDPTSLERDLLNLAAAVFAADVAIPRGERELCQRTIILDIPVVNYHLLRSVQSELRFCLYLLSHDSWQLNFSRIAGTAEPATPWPASDASVLLFSGGLDSLAEAVTLAQGDSDLALVSHDSGNAVAARSRELLLAHVRGLSSKDLAHYSFRVRGQRHEESPYPTIHEPSQRTRSFLFLTLAALVARRIGARKVIVIAENGQMAIHLPLTAARIAAFSTRTAHPEVLATFENLFSDILGVPLRISNPYLYMTKAEVVRDLCSVEHLAAVRSSTSCWKAARLISDADHCGECVPCLVRRIALEYWNVTDATKWARDLFRENIASLPHDDDGKKNLIELIEMASVFASEFTESELIFEFPALVSRSFALGQAVAMYRRFSREALQVMGRYPGPKALL